MDGIFACEKQFELQQAVYHRTLQSPGCGHQRGDCEINEISDSHFFLELGQVEGRTRNQQISIGVDLNWNIK